MRFDRGSECLATCFLPFVRVAMFQSVRLGTPCWMWEGARNEKGYGVMVLPDGPVGSNSRVSWAPFSGHARIHLPNDKVPNQWTRHMKSEISSLDISSSSDGVCSYLLT